MVKMACNDLEVEAEGGRGEVSPRWGPTSPLVNSSTYQRATQLQMGEKSINNRKLY